jgi:hypothetical protein
VEGLDTSCSNVKIEETKMVIITVAIQLVECFVIIVASLDMSSKIVSNSRKETQDSTITILTPVGNRDRENFESQDMVSLQH